MTDTVTHIFNSTTKTQILQLPGSLLRVSIPSSLTKTGLECKGANPILASTQGTERRASFRFVGCHTSQ
jgi:hypothetical protein